MTDTTSKAQQEIFNQALDGAELQAVNVLVSQHQGNAALTQQLALDASRLITTSQDRLAKQTGLGFFKRFASKISGKNSENQLQNQVDILQMQRFAWYYLKQLQQQNLINSQGIAVIRNNLGTMNDYIIETRDFLELAVDKINHRLEHVENNTSFNNWSLHIEANKRRFKSIPGNLLILHLTYDFMRSHRDLMLTSRDINYLVVTLENLGVNCDQDVRLLDFIIELIEQIEITGIERYREMIKQAFDDQEVDFHFIQQNISGIGFNALYFLSEQYEKILDLTADREICRSDKDREIIISKFFGNEFSGLSTTYRIRDLIGEVIGAGALAIDIFKDAKGLNVISDQPEEDEQPEKPQQQQQELLTKQSVLIWKDGREHLFRIKWHDVENPPCDPEKIRHIKTDGNVWLLVDDDGCFYRSEDREHWQPVQPNASKERLKFRKLDIINGVWILIVGSKEGIYYSSDALTWNQSSFPEQPSLSSDFSQTEDIVHFNGQWLWRFAERAEYSYTEKGLIFDSTKTSTCKRSLIYCTDRLDAQWQRWEGTPKFAESVEVTSMHSLPGVTCLLVFCKHDVHYRSATKKNDAEPFVSYYLPGKDWRTCTWGGEEGYISYSPGWVKRTEKLITRMADKLICFYVNELLTSDKGYDWKRHSEKLFVRDYFHLENLSLFPSQSNSQVIYLSQDAKVFKELLLNEGSWKYFCANDQGALSVYAPNIHETFLRTGQFIFQPGA